MTVVTKPKPSGPALVISRFFDAPRPLVFAAWTDPAQLACWLGPRGFTARDVALEVRPGGAWRAVIRSPEGRDHPMRGVYREVAAPERLVFTHIWGEPDAPERALLVTVTFTALGSRTKLILREAGFASAADRDAGWAGCLGRLAAHLTGED